MDFSIIIFDGPKEIQLWIFSQWLELVDLCIFEGPMEH